jgi:excisionase family DNA binding protein
MNELRTDSAKSADQIDAILADGRLVMTLEEVAKVLRISRSSAYMAARTGDLPVRRVGRRILVPVPMLRAWLGYEGPRLLGPPSGRESDQWSAGTTQFPTNEGRSGSLSPDV